MYNPEVEAYYESQMLEAKRVYSQSWSRVLHYVLEIDKPLSQQRMQPEMLAVAGMRLKDKDRQNIKDKFNVSCIRLISEVASCGRPTLSGSSDNCLSRNKVT